MDAYEINRKAAERHFGTKFEGYGECCSVADEKDSVVQKMAQAGDNRQQELSTAFAAGFIVGGLVAAGRKDDALNWLRKGRATKFNMSDFL